MGFSGTLTNGATIQMNSSQWAANAFTHIDSDARSGAAAAVNLEIYIDATTADMDLSGLIFDANWDQSRDTITVEGDAADNNIIGTSQTDTLNGGDGNDTFTVNIGAHFEELGETIAGGAGFDRLVLNDVTSPINMTDMANVSGVEALLVAGNQNADITLSAAYNSANSGLSIEDALVQGDASLTPFSTLSRTARINGIQYLLDEGLVTTSGNRIGIFEDGANGDFTLDTSGFVLNQSTFVVMNADGGNTHITTGSGEDIIVLATDEGFSVDLTTATGTTSVNGGAFSDPGDEDILVLNTNGTGVGHLLGDALQNIDRVVVNIGQPLNASITMDASYTGDNLIIDGRGITTEWSFNKLFFNGAANAAGEDLTVYGTQNNDTIQGGLGDDVLDGGDGIDTLSYADFVATSGTDGVSVDFQTLVSTQNTGAGSDTLSNFENFLGSAFDDTLFISTANFISAQMGAGEDFVQFTDTLQNISLDMGNNDDTIRIYASASSNMTGSSFDGGTGGDELDIIFSQLATDLRGATFANIETLNLLFTTSTGSGLREVTIDSSQLETFSAIYASQAPGAGDSALITVTADSALVNLSALTFSNLNDAEVTTRIEGLTTANNITGSVLNDLIIGSNVADTLNGGDGEDTFMGGGGNDAMNGGAGDDLVDYSGATNRVNVNLLSGNGSGNQAQGDTYVSIEDIIGSNLGDTLRGNNASNQIEGGNGNDVLIGFNGADILLGGAGRDILNGGDGADFLQGGAGVDQARYNGSSEGVNINLESGIASGGQAEGDTLLNIENLFGSNHDDVLFGDSNNNKIFGHLGNDSLAANGGISKLYGGAGNDSFVLSDGFAFVMDFVDDVDQLDVSDYGFATLADALMNVDQVGAHARFRFDGDVLLVLNTDMNDLMDDIVI